MNGQTLTLALSHKWEKGFEYGLFRQFRQFDTIDQFIFYDYVWMSYGKHSTYEGLK